MKYRLVMIAVVVAALAGGFWAAHALRDTAPPDSDAAVLETPRDPGAFALVDHRGAPFGPAQLRDRWTLWFFGFTNCPDVCPTTLTMLSGVDRALADAGAARPAVIMVSVDPARDTPEALAAYVPFFNDAFTGVTGAQGEVLQLAERLGIIVRYLARDDGSYTVEHGASLLLTGPDGLVHAVFTAPHDPDALARDLAALIPWLERNI